MNDLDVSTNIEIAVGDQTEVIVVSCSMWNDDELDRSGRDDGGGYYLNSLVTTGGVQRLFTTAGC